MASNDRTKRKVEVWKRLATDQQVQYAHNFYKASLDVDSFSILKNRLAVSIFGLPENKLSNDFSYKLYSVQQIKAIDNLAQCILKHQKEPDKDKIYISLIIVLGITKCKEMIRFQECVFKVPGRDGNKYIDRVCRVYDSWNSFVNENIILKATICCPGNGEYINPDTGFFVEFHDTPSCNISMDVLNGLDIASNITGAAAVAVGTTSLFIPIIGPVVFTACAVGAASALYGAGRRIENLVDRGKHGQTLSFTDSKARSDWLGATVPIIGIAASGVTAIAAVAKLSKLGITLTQTAKTAINITNGVNCVAHGAVFIHDICGIIESKMNGETITKLQIFQCVASALFFYNTVITTYQAMMILEYQEIVGDCENIYSQLGQPIYEENGINIRPPTYVSNANITPMISLFCSWGGVVLKIPPEIAKSVENIIIFVWFNRKDSFNHFVTGLLPLLRRLWETIEHEKSKSSYQNTRERPHSFKPQKPISKGKQHTMQHIKSSSRREKNRPTATDNKYTKMAEESNGVAETCFDESFSKNKPEIDNKIEECSNDTAADNVDEEKIIISDSKWEGQNELFEKVIQNIVEKENMTMFELLQISRFFFDTIRVDVAKKEELFQTALRQAPDIAEETVERMFGITGKRSQYFANEVMESYKNMKLIAIKQEYQRMIERGNILVPLYSSSNCPINLLYYKSSKKHGTKTQRFLKILEKAQVTTSQSSCTYFPSNNSCFLEITDQNSKYDMAGVINFGNDDNMMGIILLSQRG